MIEQKSWKVRFAYLIPIILLSTTIPVFYFLPSVLGQIRGYFVGFLFYWLFWCMIVPIMLVGRKEIFNLFRIQKLHLGRRPVRNILFLVLPLLLVYSYEFPKVLKQANIMILVASLILSFVNAIAEEVLWRGTYFRLLGDTNEYVLVSSLGFAAWHIAPQIVFVNKNPGGLFSFLAVAFILGLMFSTVLKDSKSIFLTIVAHILFDFAGLGARIYFPVG